MVDLTKFSVQIATPAADGRYDRAYVRSMLNTAMMFRAHDINLDWAEMPFCADLPLARAKIFGNFLRSKNTHLMMIDSDMGWEPVDIFRMFSYDVEFIAAAGPKKKWPREYALNNHTDDKTPLPVKIDEDSGLLEISHIGAAFVLINKSCAEKIAGAYRAELGFEGDDNVEEFAVFDPVLYSRNNRMSEDFAFCYRWRKIGGKILVLPDVQLKHTGSHTWVGALSDSFEGKTNEKEVHKQKTD